jgi:hypothetical protein
VIWVARTRERRAGHDKLFLIPHLRARYYDSAILLNVIRHGIVVMRTRTRECHFNVTASSYMTRAG